MNLEILYIIIYSYLLGSIPFGLILSKLFLNKDLRDVGSGNIGATNVFRAGKKILGFRAPYFSIDKKSFWAIEILSKYFKYDSSIFPVKTPLYGIKNAPRNIYKPNITNPIITDSKNSLIEIPMATDRIPLIGNIPIAGGFYLRFLPYFYMKYGLKKINKNKNSFIFYIHPKDLDFGMPKINEYTWHYYHNLKGSIKKFEKILNDFDFITIKEFLKI